MKKILIIGAFGDGSPTTSGQIIRTRITYQELKAHYGERRVLTLNTSDVSSYHIRFPLFNRIRFLFQFGLKLLRSKTVLIIVSENGMRMLYPILEKAAKWFGKRVLNSVVGGAVKPILKRYPQCRKAMKAFTINWVQLPGMIDELAAEGIFNAEVLPNSKPYTLISPDELDSPVFPPFRLCTFSRISKEKGTEDAIFAVRSLLEKGLPVTLDIYGQPDEKYRERFEELLRDLPKEIRYCGVAPGDQADQLLRPYYLLLFPTTFDGEGFPGTLVDAFFAGLPVIATDWNHNGALLTHGKTGYLYDPNTPARLADLIEYAVEHPDEIISMRKACLEEAKKYSMEHVMDILSSRIDH